MPNGIQRRGLLKSIPALAVANGISGLAATGTAEAATEGSAMTPVTYLPVAVQRQFEANRQSIAGKAYERFFNPELAVPVTAAKALQMGPLAKEECLTPSVADIQRLLDPSFTTPKPGYAVLDGSTAYVQNRLIFPEATTEMFRWWFVWHPVERERYMLWFPQAHIENSVKDPERLADGSRNYEDRIYGNPNRIKEWIGPNLLDSIIYFSEPAKLGLDPKALARAGFTVSASGFAGPVTSEPITHTLMLHLARDVEGGMELVSRYWIGGHPELRRFPNAEKGARMLREAGFNDEFAENMAYELAVHDMIEFNHLAGLLPALYRAFGSV
jgi:2,4-diacetylphloroglucinol hydrolase